MTFLAAMLPPGAVAPEASDDAPVPEGRTGQIVPKRGAAKMLDAELARPISDWCDRPIRVNGGPRTVDHLRSCGRCRTCLSRKEHQ